MPTDKNVGLVSCQDMSSGEAFVTNFCYGSVYLTWRYLVLLFYLYEDNPSGISKPPQNLAFHKLNRPSSFKSSTAMHFLWPLHYFRVTFCTFSTHLKIKGVPEMWSCVRSKAQAAVQIHDIGGIQLKVPVHIPSHGSDVDLCSPEHADVGIVLRPASPNWAFLQISFRFLLNFSSRAVSSKGTSEPRVQQPDLGGLCGDV